MLVFSSTLGLPSAGAPLGTHHASTSLNPEGALSRLGSSLHSAGARGRGWLEDFSVFVPPAMDLKG